MNSFSMNKFIVEAYTGDRALRANATTGFAMIEQRTSVKGLRTLTDTILPLGHNVEILPKGSMVYVKEEWFFQPGWAQKAFTSEGIEGSFIIVDPSFIEFIEPLYPEKTEEESGQ